MNTETFADLVLLKRHFSFKGDGNPGDKLFYLNELSEPWSLTPVSSKSVEKCESYGRLNICKWTVMEAAIL